MQIQIVNKEEKRTPNSAHLLEARRKVLESQGYRLVGNHSAIKTCHYCSAAIKGKNVCYKNTFYGVASWQCIQATVTLDFCNLRCRWCWRDINYTFPKQSQFNDEPEEIFEGFIREHRKAVMGFLGNKKANLHRAKESLKPRHIALSLTGDACMYQRLPELIDVVHNKNMTTFLVTNGTFPEMVTKLIDHQPTQIYVTLPAPDEETYLAMCRPMARDGWAKIQKSIKLLSQFRRSVLRLTLAKEGNFHNPEGYADLINSTNVNFIEIKSAMPIGYAAFRMTYEQMPTHQEITNFAKELESRTAYKIADKKEDSRVVLLTKPENKNRFLNIT